MNRSDPAATCIVSDQLNTSQSNLACFSLNLQKIINLKS